MLRVALTGGIASGKSAVADAFAALGVPVIDADISARRVVVPGSAGLKQLVATFGDGIITAGAELDRPALRQMIFSDESARARVNAILHPLIRADMSAQAAALDAPYALFVIPLLTETGQADDYDRVLLVNADLDLRRTRLRQRDQISAEQADAILAAQACDAMREKIADDRIINDGTLAQITAQVAKLHQIYSGLASNEKGQR